MGGFGVFDSAVFMKSLLDELVANGEEMGEFKTWGVASPFTEVVVDPAEDAMDSEDILLSPFDELAFFAISRLG